MRKATNPYTSTKGELFPFTERANDPCSTPGCPHPCMDQTDMASCEACYLAGLEKAPVHAAKGTYLTGQLYDVIVGHANAIAEGRFTDGPGDVLGQMAYYVGIAEGCGLRFKAIAELRRFHGADVVGLLAKHWNTRDAAGNVY